MSVRVRFPPSPTGHLHVGSVRTALYNWLLARKTGGVLVLRIEDTDRERSSPEMTQAILDGMTWMGLDWDEGPFFQSEGVERHRRDVQFLLDRGRAYRDFSTPEEVQADRAFQSGGGAVPPWRARALTIDPGEARARGESGEPHAVRFLVPDGETHWDDLVHGEQEVANDTIADFVILRQDGSPTYNLAVTSDDADSRISHVVRGDDHLSNTPKQILLYEALERPVPAFAHLPMILGSDGKRLSKRHGATSIAEYQALGILPWAMANFLALLGWSPGDDREIMDVEELTQAFSLDRVLKKSSVFDPEKLEWLNGKHMAQAPMADLLPDVRRRLEEGEPPVTANEDRLAATLDLLRERARTLADMAEQARPLLVDDVVYDPAAVAKAWKDGPGVRSLLRDLHPILAEILVEDWTVERLEEELRGFARHKGMGAGKVFQPLRVALVGSMRSPGIFETLAVLGKARSLDRIGRAAAFLETNGGVA